MTTTWSYQDFCASQVPADSWSSLPESARSFLLHLDLPSVHPICSSNDNDERSFMLWSDSVPPMGSPQLYPDDETTVDTIITMFYMMVPPFAAFISLWVRLLSGFLAPIGVLQLVWETMVFSSANNKNSSKEDMKHLDTTTSIRFCARYVMTVFCCLVVMVDYQYVFEFGPRYGISLFLASLALTLPTICRRRRKLQTTGAILILLIFVAAYLTCHDLRTLEFRLGDDPEELPKISQGLYFDSQNPQIKDVVQAWPESSRTYSMNHQHDAAAPTRWITTGDARTGLPFYLNSVELLNWHRVWLPTTDEDDEYLALDIAFPVSGHDPTKPVYMVLHGLNGGSSEGYVLDLTERRLAEGSTVVVMVARGLMDTPIKGWTLFHGARLIDAHSTALTLKQRVIEPNQMLVGVGYSLGAIVLNNYVASYGKDTALDAAVSISGSLNCYYQRIFQRSQRTWQPMIAAFMKDGLLLPKWGRRIQKRLGPDAFRAFLRASTIVEVDRHASVDYNSYSNLDHFYAEMSVLGDIAIDQLDRLTPQDVSDKKIANISIPMLVLQALDDPVSTWRNVAANHGLMHPENLVRTGQGNLVVLLTQKGGHVGWPLGWWPSKNKWKFMSDVAAGFVNAVWETRQRQQQQKSKLLDDLDSPEVLCLAQANHTT